MKPRVCILKTDGTNCDQETAHAFSLAGADTQIVLLTELLQKKHQLNDFQVLALPGGFSYGDDIASGKLFALELELFLKEQLQQFIAQKKAIIGICNGFQVLVRAKLLPQIASESQQATLAWNASGKFECRWVSLKIEKSNCIFTRGLEDTILELPVAHAEGRFYCEDDARSYMELNKLIPLRYAQDGRATSEYPANPNGSLDAIAGACDETGLVFGLMPHPERFVYAHQYPHRTRTAVEPMGRMIFQNAVSYAMQL